jgi:SagB-type dehydrogenase family enzyme
LERLLKKDIRQELALAAINQNYILEAPLDIIICADYSRTQKRYGARAIRYVHMETGRCSQNIYLQATSLGLGTVAMGAFRDDVIRDILGIEVKIKPLCLMPIGH